MNEYPETTLFLIESLDGKISTGDVDALDIDKDFKRIRGLKEGLHQYYDLQKQTDPFSLNSGSVMAKIGVNTRTEEPVKMGCSFIIIDSKPHLTREGVIYLSKWVKKLFLVTTNRDHPVFDLQNDLDNIEIIYHENVINFEGLMRTLKSGHGVTKLTIESGGELNSQWVRKNLIDHVSVVVAPCLVGGRDTSSLIDGESLHNELDLQNIKTLKLVKCDVLENSYIHLMYDVIRNTAIEA